MLNINLYSKTYNNNEILSDIKIMIEDGDFISLIGPSGCGKSTLLNMIAGIDEEYNGDILLNNKIIDFEIGFMFQDSRLLPWLSVKQNLSLVLKDKNKDELIETFLEEVGLKDYMNAYVKELSGGMKRRVALCRAFINQPKLILLDEPFISLDYPSAQELRQLFLKFYKRFRPTVILVTHDLLEAVSLTNEIIFFSSKPTQVLLSYKNEKDFSLNLQDEQIEGVKKEILDKHPNILSGVI